MILEDREILLTICGGIALGLSAAALVGSFREGTGDYNSDAAADRTSQRATDIISIVEAQQLKTEYGETSRYSESGPEQTSPFKSERNFSDTPARYSAPSQLLAGSASDNSIPYGTRPQANADAPSASRLWLDRQGRGSTTVSDPSGTITTDRDNSNIGAIDVRTGEFYAPAGAGSVSTRDGTNYAPSGPNGLIDTRTGAYVPVTP